MRRRLRLFPLNTVLFPDAALSLHVFEPRYRQMIEECVRLGEHFGVVLIASGTETGDPNVRPHAVGTVAEILEVARLPFERYYVAAIGGQRFRIHGIVDRDPFLTADVETVEETAPNVDDELAAVVAVVRELFAEYRVLLAVVSGKDVDGEILQEPTGLSFAVADTLAVSQSLKQRLLEIDDTGDRLRSEKAFLERALPRLQGIVERRRVGGEIEAAQNRTDRGHQERYFGKFFSAN